MLVGIEGKMGSGKTFAMSMLACALSDMGRAMPLWANYHLEGAKLLGDTQDLWHASSGIVAFDELHRTMDSREWSKNISMTHFITHLRKKQLLFMFTTQHINQVDLRIRQNMDYLIYVERRGLSMTWNFIDWQYKELGRRYKLSDPRMFWDLNLYDSLEVVEPLPVHNLVVSS